MSVVKIIDVVPKDIHITVEFSSRAIERILDFFEKSIALYSKVYIDGPIDESLATVEDFKYKLESVLKTMKEENEKGLLILQGERRIFGTASKSTLLMVCPIP